MRRGILALLMAAALLLLPFSTRAIAHGGDLTAIVSLAPDGALRIVVQDAYTAKLTGAKVNVSLRPDGAQSGTAAPARPDETGTYRAVLQPPNAAMSILRVEVTVLTEIFTGEFPVDTVSGVDEIGVTLMHQDQPAGPSRTFDPRAPLPTEPAQILAVLLVIGAPVLLALVMQWRRRPAKK